MLLLFIGEKMMASLAKITHAAMSQGKEPLYSLQLFFYGVLHRSSKPNISQAEVKIWTLK